jgi:hypothetical protein
MSVFVVFEYVRHEGSRIRAIFDSSEKARDYVYNNEPDHDEVWLDWDEWQVN